jgi:hypothetical protein
MRLTSVLVVLASLVISPGTSAQQPRQPVDNVLVVTLDGVRWQEVFGGAQRELISKSGGGVGDTAGLIRRFWTESARARREALMPFFWSEVAKRGVILGDSAEGSTVRVTNGKRFSYPGYNELLAGHPDDRIDSNDKIPNPNVTVLEWLNRRSAFAGRVAAFGSWDVLPYIVNRERSGLYANGDGPPVSNPRTAVERAMNALAASLPPYWGNVRFDGVTMQGALHYLRTRQPRVLYVMLGDTDEWAHERRYDLYLDAINRGDRFIRTLWETMQAMPEYRGKTALLLATDHGRGSGSDWTDHGRDVPAAERIWMAVLKPEAFSRQPSAISGSYTQSQFAATVAGLLGLERAFRGANPKAAPSIFTP